MELPELKQYKQKIKRQIVNFGGINLTDAPRDGELLNSEGLSSARFPVLSQRPGRVKVGVYAEPTAIFAWNKLCVVDGTTFYYDDNPVGPVLSGEKQWAVIGTKYCFWPDKKYLDISDPSNPKLVNLDAEVTALTGTVSFTANSITLNANPPMGELLTRTGRSWYSNEEACIVADGTVIKASQAVVGMRVRVSYNEAQGYYISGAWTDQYANLPPISAFPPENTNGVYAKIKSVNRLAEPSMAVDVTEIVYTLYDSKKTNADLRDFFAAGDMVTISGCTTYPANNKSAIVKSVSSSSLTFAASTFTAGSEAAAVVIRRSVPDFDFICEWDNRLWGVKGQTIYASALGDPRNFSVYEGLSTDSYTVSVGTDGKFTGICAYSDCLLAWKENYLHKIVGSQPSDYYMFNYNITGLEAGSHKSLKIINEVLFYKGRDGVYAYTGNTPRLISYNLGQKRFTNATAGTDGSRYYISMQDEDGNWHLFVYDTLHDIWLREDGSHVADFTNLDGTLYFLVDTSIYKIQQRDSDEEIKWMAEFTPFTENFHQRKSYSRLYFRLELADNAYLKIEIKCDDLPWRTMMTLANPKERTITIPIRPNRCDTFRIRLSGKGGCVISSMEREFQLGSEV